MKELLISFLVCLVIGAVINGMSSAPPAATTTETSTQPTTEPTVESNPGSDPTSDPSGATTEGATTTTTGGTATHGGKAPETSDANFDQDVLKSQVPVLVDFGAAWCAPCQSMAPIIDKLASDYKGKVKVYKVDTDRNPTLSAKFHVNSLPTFMMFRDGRPVSQYSGAMPKEMLVGVIDHQLGTQ